MNIPELFLFPVLGFVAHSFLGLVYYEHVFCVLREHQFDEIGTYKAFLPSEIFSGGHTSYIALRKYINITVTASNPGNPSRIFNTDFTPRVNYIYYGSYTYEYSGQKKIFFSTTIPP